MLGGARARAIARSPFLFRPFSSISVRDALTKRLIPLGDNTASAAPPPIPPAAPTPPPPLKFYACGPTVYDDAHIGHARTYVTLDILRRVLERERAVVYALGVTDIDDKIVARARAEKTTPRAVSARFERSFFEDLAALRVRPPTTLARVSEHIPDVLAFAAALVERGAAYVVARPAALGAGGASVYLDVRALGGAYGKLAPAGAREVRDDGEGAAGADAGVGYVVADDGGAALGREWRKRDARDFALWRGVSASEVGGSGAGDGDSNDGDGWAWASPWGVGRPGWHLECSAMTRHIFGSTLDVHAGGVDLAFPHHCNECAQADALAGPDARAAGYAWVSAWVHTGHVHIEGRKMSKSLKNFVRVRDMLDSGGEAARAVAAAGGRGPFAVADAFRLWCLGHHYSDSLTYAPARLGDAAAVARRLDGFLASALAIVSAPVRAPGAEPGRWTAADEFLALEWSGARADAARALANDFDTTRALRALSAGAAAGARYVAEGGAARGLLASVARELAAELAALGLGFAAEHAEALDRRRGELRGTWESAAAVADAGDVGADVATCIVEQRTELRARVADARKAMGTGGGDAATRDALVALVKACDAASDATRDKVLPRLGWTLADTAAGPRIVKR